MSKTNRDGKREARERLAAERARREQAQRRNKRLAVGGSVVGVIVIAVLVGLLVSSMSSSSSGFPGGKAFLAPSGALAGADVAASGLQGGAGQDGIALPVGSSTAPLKLSVFEDFRCPVCDEMEKVGIGAAMQQYAKDGKLQIQYHIASFIDRNDGGNGSKQAANAAACAQDAGSDYFVQYHNVLYANQPAETDDGFGSTQTLLNLANKVPGLASPTFTTCVNTAVHAGWVTASQSDFDQRGITGTPTVVLDGTVIPVVGNSGMMTVAQFDAAINAEIIKKGGTPETPTPTGIPSPTAPAAPTSPATAATSPASTATTRPTGTASPTAT